MVARPGTGAFLPFAPGVVSKSASTTYLFRTHKSPTVVRTEWQTLPCASPANRTA